MYGAWFMHILKMIFKGCAAGGWTHNHGVIFSGLLDQCRAKDPAEETYIINCYAHIKNRFCRLHHSWKLTKAESELLEAMCDKTAQNSNFTSSKLRCTFLLTLLL